MCIQEMQVSRTRGRNRENKDRIKKCDSTSFILWKHYSRFCFELLEVLVSGNESDLLLDFWGFEWMNEEHNFDSKAEGIPCISFQINILTWWLIFMYTGFFFNMN